jgi:hypothetical protein
MTTRQTVNRLSRGIEALALTVFRKPVQVIFMDRDETTEEAITRHFADHPGRREDYQLILVRWDWEGKYLHSSQHHLLEIIR